MSKKTSTKKTAKKAVSNTKPAATKTGECPKGGAHEWTEENGENFCSKCKEPKSAKRKAKAAKSEKKLSALDAAAKSSSPAPNP